jgi:hypothetical protein
MPFIYGVVDAVFGQLGSAVSIHSNLLEVARGIDGRSNQPVSHNERILFARNGDVWFEIVSIRGIQIRQLFGFRQVIMEKEAREEVIKLV